MSNTENTQYELNKGLAFHPELSQDPGIHAHFLQMCGNMSPVSAHKLPKSARHRTHPMPWSYYFVSGT